MKRAGTGSAADFLPPVSTLPALREAAAGCRGCGLYRYATQTVFGEGPPRARLMLVGEQPGDQEDRAGHPFVGPSGRLLDEALTEAGIDRGTVYVTNAVKHFKFVRQELTRRRLHKKPAAGEVRACRPWLEEEVKVIRPALIVALGSTAAQSLLGPQFRVTRERGHVVESPAGPVLATVHPSAILRAPSETRAADQRAFVRDLTEAARWLARATARRARPGARPARRSSTSLR
ncbi:MAG TPA: UdgX family uracil-DNA binding protein [Gemmatimonadales bacterium]|nr:UdgX family uracil-DNA binding protein [Gemmatimonadales bacterium]